MGFVFAVEVYGFFSHTASTAVSYKLMSSLLFYSETGKCSEKKTGIILLKCKEIKTAFSCWLQLLLVVERASIMVDFDHILGNHF